MDRTKLAPAVADLVTKIESEYPELMTAAEAADVLRVEPPTVRRLISDGDLVASRIGERKTLVYRDSLIELLVKGLVS